MGPSWLCCLLVGHKFKPCPPTPTTRKSDLRFGHNERRPAHYIATSGAPEAPLVTLQSTKCPVEEAVCKLLSITSYSDHSTDSYAPDMGAHFAMEFLGKNGLRKPNFPARAPNTRCTSSFYVRASRSLTMSFCRIGLRHL